MKIWKTCIYFQSQLILVVNVVDRVFILCQSKDFQKIFELPTEDSQQNVYVHKRMKDNKAKETSIRYDWIGLECFVSC